MCFVIIGIIPIAITTNDITTPPPYDDDAASDYYSMTPLSHSSAVTDLDTALASLENKEIQSDVSYDEDEDINEGAICRSPQLNWTEPHIILNHWIITISTSIRQKM